MSDKESLGCAVAAVFILVPVILLIIGVVQLNKLKAAVRHLVQRVAALESRPSPTVAPAAGVVPREEEDERVELEAVGVAEAGARWSKG